MLVEYESEGNSIVYFGRKNELLAIIAVKDQLKAAALGTVRELRASELDICMLTGDGERTASTIAGKLGLYAICPMHCRTIKRLLYVSSSCKENGCHDR